VSRHKAGADTRRAGGEPPAAPTEPAPAGPAAHSAEAAGARRFMTVPQAARYLQINEKKVYELAAAGALPGTKVTGKWLFPRLLVDQWLLESSHGGLLSDRLVVAGSDDPLLARAVAAITGDMPAKVLVSYAPTGTLAGLALLAARRTDACALHWGPAQESERRHVGLITPYARHREWILVRAFLREQGIVVSRELAPPAVSAPQALFARRLRWVLRQEGSGTHRYLAEIASRHGVEIGTLDAVAHAPSEREAASLVASGRADAAPGPRAAAGEFGLGFVPAGWEAFDLVTTRAVYFRALFRRLLEAVGDDRARGLAARLGGYRFEETGRVVWAAE